MTSCNDSGPQDETGGSGVRPSTVKLPELPPVGVRTIFDFFVLRFPRIPRSTWERRFAAGKVWAKSLSVDSATPYRPLLEVHYRREVEREPPVREDFTVVWSDQHLMVVDKPPHLPIIPGGRWVRNCLIHISSEAFGNKFITPLHRLDRLTSGLVMLSLNPSSRSHYSRLFQPAPLIDKVYTAVCEIRTRPPGSCFELTHHIARDPDEYWRQRVCPGVEANARSEVEIVEVEDGLARVRVRPTTGRKHQIRVQLAAAGLPILGDPLYGSDRSYDPWDLETRLWLDAHQLVVRDFSAAPGGLAFPDSWKSSRSPDEFFRRALDRRSGPPR